MTKPAVMMALIVLSFTFSAPLSAATEEDKACSGKKGGICACSQGRVICCDGSGAPKYSWSGGRLVTQDCSEAVTLHSQPNAGQRPDRQTLDATQPGVVPPSHEGFWKRSVFDR